MFRKKKKDLDIEEQIGLNRRDPDVEALITNTRKTGSSMGQRYRPAFLVKSDYLTTGQICFSDREWLAVNDTALSTVTFLSPEAYPSCLWVGKRVNMQEGNRITGYAIITKIFNKILESNSEKSTETDPVVK